MIFKVLKATAGKMERDYKPGKINISAIMYIYVKFQNHRRKTFLFLFIELKVDKVKSELI